MIEAGDGRPQGRGLLLGLSAIAWPRRCCASPPRLRRRRQVDADRPPAARHQGDPRRPAHARACERRGDGELNLSRADRRPARRARAGHHDRRRLPLLRDAERATSSSPTRPATCSTRATWSPAPRPPTSRIVLVDARNGVVEQTRRHAFIASLLRHPAPRRRDQQDGPRRLRRGASSTRSSRDFSVFRKHSTSRDIAFIPISALQGDNVVDRSREHAVVRRRAAARPPRARRGRRRPQPRGPALPGAVGDPPERRAHDYRGYAGQVAGGVAAAGRRGRRAAVRARRRRSRRSTRSTARWSEAFPPLSVTLRLDDDVDVSRGDLICVSADDAPEPARELEADVCWMADRRCGPAARTRSSTRRARPRPIVERARRRVDVHTLERGPARDRARRSTTSAACACAPRTPLVVRPLRAQPRDRAPSSSSTRSTNDTVGAGMIARR